jgi:hypothetical protein
VREINEGDTVTITGVVRDAPAGSSLALNCSHVSSIGADPPLGHANIEALPVSTIQ